MQKIYAPNAPSAKPSPLFVSLPISVFTVRTIAVTESTKTSKRVTDEIIVPNTSGNSMLALK